MRAQFVRWGRVIIVVALVCALLLAACPVAHAAPNKIVTTNVTYSYTRMEADIQRLQARYPDLVRPEVIGTTPYGRKIYAVALGPTTDAQGNALIKANVFINGAHHAREWLTTTLNMKMIEEYAQSYTEGTLIGGYNTRDVLTTTTIWFVPMINPDGVTLAQYGLKKFPKKAHKKLLKMNKKSKDFKRWKSNAQGVDLNRNYDTGDWKKSSKAGLKGAFYKNYKGKKAASARETRAVQNFVNRIRPSMVINYHSTGKVIYWGERRQSTAQIARDKAYATQLRKLTGYWIMGRSTERSAGFLSYVSYKQKVPTFTLEIGKSRYESPVPVKEFPKTWAENHKVGLYVAAEGAKLAGIKLPSPVLPEPAPDPDVEVQSAPDMTFLQEFE